MQPDDPMTLPTSHLPAWIGYTVLGGMALYILLCYWVGYRTGRRSDLGHMDTFILCLVTSPLVGYLVARSKLSKGGHTCKWCGQTQVVTQWCPSCGKDQAGNEVGSLHGRHAST